MNIYTRIYDEVYIWSYLLQTTAFYVLHAFLKIAGRKLRSKERPQMSYSF